MEVEQTLSMPHRLVVVDRSPRILSAVSRRLPQARCHCVDISLAAPPHTADVVIAFNVVGRLENPQAGMAHVTESVKPGGWLLIDDRAASAYLAGRSDFENVAAKIHRRLVIASI
jgi:trans-aconitate methyltransferase